MNSKEQTERFSDPFSIFAATAVRVVRADRLKVSIEMGFGLSRSVKINLRGVRMASQDKVFCESARTFVRNELMRSLEKEGDVDEEAAHPLGFKNEDVWFSEDATMGCLGKVVLRAYPIETPDGLLVWDDCEADVWYLKDEIDSMKILKNGKLLNQVLLDQGMAEKVE